MPRFLLALLKPYRRWLLLVFVMMLVEVAMSLAAPWTLKLVLDDALEKHRLPRVLEWAHDLGIGRHTLGVAMFAGLATVVIAVFGAVANYLDNYYTASIGQWVANDLRIRLFTHMNRLSLAFYDKAKGATLISTVTTDVATVQAFASAATLGILVDVLTIVFMLALMLWLDRTFTLVAMAAMPFLVLFVLRFKSLVKSATREVRVRQSEIVAVVQEGLASLRATEAFGREDLQVAHMRDVSRASAVAALRARSIKSLLSPTVTVIVAVCTGVVLWQGTMLVSTSAMTVGALTVYLAYLAKFFKPVKDLAGIVGTVAQVTVALERIEQILKADEILSEHPNASDPGHIRGEVTFDHVAFGYDPQTQVLRDISFFATAGQTVAIVGPTGSGKSTIASLIPRFYDPTSGSVLIDGVDIRRHRLAALRSRIGFVLQETVLFRGTIADNIAYGKPGATTEEVVAAARLANADEFIDRMPLGYDSMVGERGETLSGGQRQRIGIARAVIRNSPIMVLDEPTAALDVESEHFVVEGLSRLMKGRTVIMIAHRLSTLSHADKIVVIKDGIVAEEGTADALLARNGLYAELWRTQRLAESDKADRAD